LAGYYNTFVVRIWYDEAGKMARGRIQHIGSQIYTYFENLEDMNLFILSYYKTKWIANVQVITNLNNRPSLEYLELIKEEKQMSTEQNKANQRRIFEEGFNKGDLSITDELIAQNWVYRGAEGIELKGPDGFKQFITMYRTAFPDLNITVHDMLAEGDKVATVGIISGTFKGSMMGIAPTGKSLKITAMAISRFIDGKEFEVLQVMDQLSMFQQLGIIPAMGPGKK